MSERKEMSDVEKEQWKKYSNNNSGNILVDYFQNKVETKHMLEYSIYSCKVSWCPICCKHFYNEQNEEHTTKATDKHYHVVTK